MIRSKSSTVAMLILISAALLLCGCGEKGEKEEKEGEERQLDREGRKVAWGDEADVETRIGKLGKTSVRFDHRIALAEGRTVLEGTATMVFVDPQGKPVNIPPAFRKAVEG